MAKRKPFSRWTWREYLLQLSIVILGVMVTFIGSGLVTRWSQARQVRSVMQLIVSELEVNRHNMAYVFDKLAHDRAGMQMLGRYACRVDSIPGDSLLYYNNILGDVHSFKPQSDALEVLKSSGLIASVEDKQLLLELLGCYNGINALSGSLDIYNNRKLDAMNHLFRNMTFAEQQSLMVSADYRASWRRMLEDPMCMGFFTSHANFFGKGYDSGSLALFDRMIALLNEKYGFQ